jgi:hypothetical protein
VLLNFYQNDDHCKLATKADRINMFFTLLRRQFEKHNLSVILALSKADDPTIMPEYKENNYLLLRQKAMRVYDEVYACVLNQKSRKWSFGIVPVSAIGHNVANTEKIETGGAITPIAFNAIIKAGSFPVPFGIDVAMIHSIYSVLKVWEYEFDALINREEYAINKDERVLSVVSDKNTFWGNLFASKDNKPEDQVRQLRASINTHDKTIRAHEEMLRRIDAAITEIVESIRPYDQVFDRIDSFPIYSYR